MSGDIHYPTLTELRALGDRSPDNESIHETIKLLEMTAYPTDGESEAPPIPLSRRKVIELSESVIACRDALAASRAEAARLRELLRGHLIGKDMRTGRWSCDCTCMTKEWAEGEPEIHAEGCPAELGRTP